jgi:hypothetical protein
MDELITTVQVITLLISKINTQFLVQKLSKQNAHKDQFVQEEKARDGSINRRS